MKTNDDEIRDHGAVRVKMVGTRHANPGAGGDGWDVSDTAMNDVHDPPASCSLRRTVVMPVALAVWHLETPAATRAASGPRIRRPSREIERPHLLLLPLVPRDSGQVACQPRGPPPPQRTPRDPAISSTPPCSLEVAAVPGLDLRARTARASAWRRGWPARAPGRPRIEGQEGGSGRYLLDYCRGGPLTDGLGEFLGVHEDGEACDLVVLHLDDRGAMHGERPVRRSEAAKRRLQAAAHDHLHENLVADRGQGRDLGPGAGHGARPTIEPRLHVRLPGRGTRLAHVVEDAVVGDSGEERRFVPGVQGREDGPDERYSGLRGRVPRCGPASCWAA